ncbi:choline dehydrogenase [Penicillium expansum]|nr:choline dehydrogenase [Penicillium expansum]
MATPRILAALALVTFDYVIVGAGAEGLTVASRLSENLSVPVAVIEAGTWSTLVTGNQSQVPADDFYYNGKAHNETNPLVCWEFLTTPQAVYISLPWTVRRLLIDLGYQQRNRTLHP